VLAAYSMPFVLVIALVISAFLQAYGFPGTLARLIFLSASFPIGFSLGRTVYLRRSHVEIMFDNIMFRLIKGSREVTADLWKSYEHVSIVLDQYGRPDLRLYKSLGGEHIDLPISRTNVDPQGFRDFVQRQLSTSGPQQVSPQVVEAA
jgi:hypothetical protein